jgi:hypothetical protein
MLGDMLSLVFMSCCSKLLELDSMSGRTCLTPSSTSFEDKGY